MFSYQVNYIAFLKVHQRIRFWQIHLLFPQLLVENIFKIQFLTPPLQWGMQPPGVGYLGLKDYSHPNILFWWRQSAVIAMTSTESTKSLFLCKFTTIFSHSLYGKVHFDCVWTRKKWWSQHSWPLILLILHCVTSLCWVLDFLNLNHFPLIS